MKLLHNIAAFLVSCQLINSCKGFSFQMPFGLPQLLSDTVEEMAPGMHYSSLAPCEHPIDLFQYMGHIVVRVDYGDNKELKKLLVTNKDHDFTVWSKSRTNKTIDLQITPENLEKLVAIHDINYKVIIDDLAQKIYETYPENHKQLISIKSESQYKYQVTEDIVKETKANVFSEMFFKDYRPLETIDAWLSIIEETFPNLVKIETIGETFEGRPYKVIHLSDHANDDHSDRKTVVISGGVHAREWISVSSVCYQLYAVLNMYTTNPESFNGLDFLFIPVINPDGYDYTWTTDRLWRKNRQNTTIERCKGVDIDHSYDFHWTKSNDWPCGEEYSGEEPFEAKELKIWHDYLNKTNNDHKIYGFIDLHSYSEEILFPYAYSCNSEPRDEENLIELSYGISKAIRVESGKSYNVLPACQDKDSDLLPDLGSGTLLDYMYHNRAFWAYQIKLRDTGNHGFLLPSKYIEPVGSELFAGMKYFIEFITNDD